MAGIGFLLRKLGSQDNLSGIVRAYLHSAIAAVGPWILIVITLGFVSFYTSYDNDLTEGNEFLAVIIYNFFFSFILSGPLYLVSARYVADSLYLRQFSPIPGIFINSLFYSVIGSLVVAIPFYIFYAKMTPFNIILSIINFVLLSQIWIVMLFLGCIRNFSAITISWVMGMFLIIFLTLYFGIAYGAIGMLFNFDMGLIVLLSLLIANILVEYPNKYRNPKEFPFYFRQYKGLFWSGFFLYAGMWIDKVIMWGAPEGVTHLNNLRTYPVYDGGMFLSYLSIIPVMGLFVFSLETNFYDSYIRYIKNIENNEPYSFIEEERINLCGKIIENGRSFIILQGSITLIIFALAPTIFKWIGFDFSQLSIFRQGTLGAFFAALNLFIFIIFTYFDSQNNLLKSTITMFISNVVLTLISLKMGFTFYGYGYSLSMILTFFVSSSLLVRFLNELNYHIFITNIIKRQTVTENNLETEQRINFM